MASSSKESKRKSQGLCPRCGKPNDRDAYYCTVCKNEHTKETRARKDLYRRLGICSYCGKEKLYGDEKSCLSCREKVRARKERYLEKKKCEIDRKTNERRRRKYQECKQAGICTKCMKNKAEEGYSKCLQCRNKIHDYPSYIKHSRSEIKREERWKHGLCFFCDERIKPGYKVCEKHYEHNCEIAKLCPKEARQKIKNYIWGR